MLELFPARLGDEIHSENVGGFIDNIYKIPLSMRDSLFVNRIRKALELLQEFAFGVKAVKRAGGRTGGRGKGG